MYKCQLSVVDAMTKKGTVDQSAIVSALVGQRAFSLLECWCSAISGRRSIFRTACLVRQRGASATVCNPELPVAMSSCRLLSRVLQRCTLTAALGVTPKYALRAELGRKCISPYTRFSVVVLISVIRHPSLSLATELCLTRTHCIQRQFVAAKIKWLLEPLRALHIQIYIRIYTYNIMYTGAPRFVTKIRTHTPHTPI